MLRCLGFTVRRAVSRQHNSVCKSLIASNSGLYVQAYSTSPYEDESRSAEFAAARKWFADFSRASIPTKVAQTSFSRSSGPGGQKVNKTSSKATTVWPLSGLKCHIPKLLHAELQRSSYYVASSDSISIQCDSHRGQSQNEDETHDRLVNEIKRIYSNCIPGVTTEEQKKKVAGLQRSENNARLKMKKRHGDKKSARSGGKLGGD